MTELVKIDPANPLIYKKQLLFYNDQWKIYRLGSVDYIRTDEQGTRTIYKPFEPIKFYVGGSVETRSLDFVPTHYVALDLENIPIK